MKNVGFQKRALAVLLAVTMILSCVTVSLSVFAQDAPFGVPSSSPAVPLYAGKAIDLQNLSIEVGGSFKSGDTLDWTLISGNSAEVKSGFVVGIRSGVTKFSVSDDTNTQNVYVIVNPKGQSEFNLVDLDFNENAYNADDWVSGATSLNKDEEYASNINGMFTTGAYKIKNIGLTTKTVNVATDNGTVAKTALLIPAPQTRFSQAGAFYKNDYLNDFYDISINAEMSYVGTGDNYISPCAAAGLYARVDLNKDAQDNGDLILGTNQKCNNFKFRNYGGLFYGSAIADNSATGYETATIAGGIGLTWFTKNSLPGGLISADARELLPGDYLNKDYVMYPDGPKATEYTVKNVEIELSGMDVKYWMNGNKILDTTAGAMTRYTLDYRTNQQPFSPSSGGIDVGGATYTSVWNQNIHNSKGGTIGFSNNNAANNNYGGSYDSSDLYIYSVKATPVNIKNAEELPAMIDMGGGEVYETIPINARMNLSQIDSEVVWDDVRTLDYEVKNGVLNGYSGAGKTITLTGKKLGENYSKELKIVEKGGFSDYKTVKFADDQMTIIPILTSNTDYQVKISRNYAVNKNTLKVNANGQSETLYDDIGDGCTYAFTTALADNMVIAAQYTSHEKAIKSISIEKGWIRQGDGKTTTDALRFEIKIPAIVWDGVSVNPKMAEFCTDKIEVGGKEVTLENTGTFIIPQVLLNGAELKVSESAGKTFNPATDKKLLVNGVYAANVLTRNLSTITELYSEAYAVISDLKVEKNFDAHAVKFEAVSYIQYADDEGNRGYIYSAPFVTSYNEIYDSAYKFDESSATLDKLFVPTGLGTDYDLDNSEETTNISYRVGDSITFMCEVQGAYTIDWKLYKDNPKVNAISEFGEQVVTPNQSAQTNTPVLTGSGLHKVAITTKMLEPGSAKLICYIKDSTGRQIRYGGGDAYVIITAVAGREDIKQPLEISVGKPTSYVNKDGQTVNQTTDEFIEAMKSTFDSRVSTVNARMDEKKQDLINFINSADQGDKFTIDDTLYLYCAVDNGVYRYFDFIVSVNDTVGLTTTNESTRLFTDSCYSTAAKQTGLPQYNLRPATGCIAIPYNSAGMTKFKSFYIGYGGHAGNRNGGTAGTFYLMTNAHGYDNTFYFTKNIFSKLNSTSVNAGGIQNCIMGSDEYGITDPTQSYAYGMIYRDYVALKAGETLFDYLTNNAKITDFTVTGSSMGAFQAHFITSLEKKITYTESMIPWMTTVGQENTDNFLSTFMPKNNKAVYYFSTVSAAQYTAKTMNERPSNYRVKVSGGLSDPTSPVTGTMALFNAFKDADCEKWLAVSQFQYHGSYPFNWSGGFDHVTQVKNY